MSSQPDHRHAQPMPTPDLAGLLTRRPSTQVATPQPASPTRRRQSESAESDEDSRAPANTVDPPAAGMPSTSARVYLQSITVYLPRTTAQQLAEAATAAGLTRTAFILHAVNATHTDLAKAIDTAQVGVGEGNLFAVPQAERPTKAPSV